MLETPPVSVTVNRYGEFVITLGGERLAPPELLEWIEPAVMVKFRRAKLTKETMTRVESFITEALKDLAQCELLTSHGWTTHWHFEQPDGTLLEYLERRQDRADRFAVELFERLRDGKKND